MKTIRNNVFETNSSSTHSIAIPKSCESNNFISFRVGEFGWGWEEVNPADYFYTAIYETSSTEKELREKLNKFCNILESRGISYELYPVKYHTSMYDGVGYLSLDDGYINHGSELTDFVNELLNDGDRLVRFLSRGLVFTGNDNSDAEERCFIERDQEYLNDYNWHTKIESKIKNPYYMEDHNDYDWYWKGN